MFCHNAQASAWYVEQVALADIARNYPTPCYIYSQAELRRAYDAIKNAFATSRPHIHYAVKSNDTLAVLQRLAQWGAGFDIVSGGELARVLAAGGAPAEIVFSGVGKRQSEIADALQAGIGCFNVESEAELARIEQCAQTHGAPAPVSLRLTFGIDAHTHRHLTTGLSTGKFGVSVAQGRALARRAHESAHLNFLGLSAHIGSHVDDEQIYIALTEAMAAAVAQLQQDGVPVAQVDMGGGFGIDDSQPHPALPSFAAYDRQLHALFARQKIIIEPGRCMSATMGALLTRVEYVKPAAGKTIWVVDAAMNDLLRPALYDAAHPVVNIGESAAVECMGDVVGPVCESADIIASNRLLAAAAGEHLLILNAGAYGAVMASNYNTRPRPAALWIDGSNIRTVRRAETTADLLARDAKL